MSAQTTENHQIAQTNAALALAYLEKNNVETGKAKLMLAQTQAPTDPLIWDTSGYFLAHIGNFSEANQAYLNQFH